MPVRGFPLVGEEGSRMCLDGHMGIGMGISQEIVWRL
jgi:hypothetical protein